MLIDGVSISLTTKTVGPRHDPYSREILTVVKDGVTHELTSCSLAGVSYKRDGVKVAEALGCGFDHASMNAVDAVSKAFEAATGKDPGDWYSVYGENYVEDPMGSLSDYE